MAFFRQRRGTLAAPVSRLPWTISILSTPLGKWSLLPHGPSGLSTTSPGPRSVSMPGQSVCHQEPDPLTEGLCRWRGSSLCGAVTDLPCLWDGCGLEAGLLVGAVGWVPQPGLEGA